MMMKIGAAAIAVLLVSNAITGWLLKGAYKDIGVAEAAVATSRQAVVDQQEALAEVKELYEREQEKVTVLGRDLFNVRAAHDQALSDINKYRGRLASTAMKDPERVGRLATEATRKLMCEIHAGTGGKEHALCESSR